jgi:glycosyltransferase involved in cell wall biosynthesis
VRIWELRADSAAIHGFAGRLSIGSPVEIHRLKVLIAAPYFWPRIGGMENYARFLARGLADAGYEVTVVCGDLTVKRPVLTEVDNLAVWRLPIWKVVSNTPINLSWWWLLRRIIRIERPDVINAHTPVPFMVDMVTWAAGNRPVIVTYHAATLFKPSGVAMGLITRGYLAIQWLTLWRARAIIAVSPYVREQLARWRSKTVVVTNAVTGVGPPRTASGTGLIFVNNLEPTHRWKGLDLLLDALAVLKREASAVTLTVVGDGADRLRYEQRARELGLDHVVQFAGMRTGPERDALIREAAAVVLYPTTANDAFPTVMLEAWAQGTPVVAAAIGSLPSLVSDDVTGLLVEANNAKALADRLRAALADPVHLVALGEAGRQLVAGEYTWPRQVERTRAVFENHLARLSQ